MKAKEISIEEMRALMHSMARRAGSDKWLIFRNKAGVGSPNFMVGAGRTACSGNWVGEPTQSYNMLAHFVTDDRALYIGRPRPTRSVQVVGHTTFGVPRHRFHMVDVQKFVLKPGEEGRSLFSALVGAEVSSNSVTYTYWPKAGTAPTSGGNKARASGISRGTQASPVVEAALREGLSQADAQDIEQMAYRRSPLHQLLKRGLLKMRGSTCAVTGPQPKEMLVASHIKPWAKCTPSERRDPDNVLLLLPPIDFLFDRGYLSFKANGTMDVRKLTPAQLRHFGLTPEFRAIAGKLSAGTRAYLQMHREFWGFK